jgi:hypothetical protein
MQSSELCQSIGPKFCSPIWSPMPLIPTGLFPIGCRGQEYERWQFIWLHARPIRRQRGAGFCHPMSALWHVKRRADAGRCLPDRLHMYPGVALNCDQRREIVACFAPADLYAVPRYNSSEHRLYALPAGAKAVPELYDLYAVWSAESLERRRSMRAKAQPT